MLFPLAALCFILVFGNCRVIKKQKHVEHQQHINNYLVAYGEYLYQREACGDCHVLHINGQTSKLRSLDGVGGKYSNAILHALIEFPDAFFFQTEMPPSPHLLKTPLDKNTLEQIVKKEGTKKQKKQIDVIWKKLNAQADIDANSMDRKYAAPADRTEVLALMAYLQQLPTSEAKVRADSIRDAALWEREKVKNEQWDAINWNDGQNIVLQNARDKANSSKGQAIFMSNCTPCHGEKGGGIIGPNLTDEYWLHGGQDQDIARTITYGIPHKGMISWKSQLAPDEVGKLVAYIRSIQGSAPENAKSPQGTKH